MYTIACFRLLSESLHIFVPIVALFMHNVSFILFQDEDVVTTTSLSAPVKSFDDLFGGGGTTNGTSSKIVFNKDSDDESDHGGVSANVEELIKASDDEEGEAIGIDW